MNENINLVEILKDAPKGTKLWSPICGECEYRYIFYVKAEDNKTKIPIIHTHTIKDSVLRGAVTKHAEFLKDGQLESCNSKDGECMLFPSKDNRNWSTFKAPWKHKNFEPFQKVLVPGIIDNVYYWSANFYSHYDKKHKIYVLIDGQTIHDDEYIIPYESNEDKLGKPVE